MADFQFKAIITMVLDKLSSVKNRPALKPHSAIFSANLLENLTKAGFRTGLMWTNWKKLCKH